MTDIERVRMIAQDVPISHVEVMTLEEGSTVAILPNSPVQPESVIITGTGTVSTFTVSGPSGRVTFSGPLQAQEVTVVYSSVYLPDDHIQELLTMNEGTQGQIKLAAADALDIMASNESIIQKKQRVLDFQTDGPAVAASLRAHAKLLRDQVYAEGNTDPSTYFDVLEGGCIHEREPFTDEILG